MGIFRLQNPEKFSTLSTGFSTAQAEKTSANTGFAEVFVENTPVLRNVVIKSISLQNNS